VQVDEFVRQTINLNGSLDDWKGVVPVILDSQTFENRSDPTKKLLNPALEQSGDASGKPQIVAQVYTAYDDTNVYLAAWRVGGLEGWVRRGLGGEPVHFSCFFIRVHSRDSRALSSSENYGPRITRIYAND
jgi:hypothetical protein